MQTRWLALVLTAALSACASAPGIFSSSPAQRSPLAAEEKWLREWFSGTPVEVGTQDDGALRVAVPVKHAFDPGQAQVKAPLGAVLDKVATSLRRQPGTKVELTAPTEGNASGAARADRMRDYLVGRGVRASRIARGDQPARMVELRVLPPPKAIERLEDSEITGSGTRGKR